MRTCTSCLASKSEAEFYKQSGGKRFHGRCKECHKEQTKARQRLLRGLDPDGFRAKQRAQRAKHNRQVLATVKCLHCGGDVAVSSPSQVGRKKFCSQSCIGKFHGRRDVERIAALKKGSLRPDAVAKRNAALRRGPAHPAYRDGSGSKQRPKALMRRWRTAVFERDDYTCQGCGQRGGQLQADHIKPYSEFPNLRWDIGNGRTLCVPCHRETPTYGRKQAKRLQALQREGIVL